jgi:hypothetical protein
MLFGKVKIQYRIYEEIKKTNELIEEICKKAEVRACKAWRVLKSC